MKKGFTLVELLGVIVVLAIVMGLAVVGVTNIVDNGKKGVYKDYEKTLQTAGRNYLIEHTEKLPAINNETRISFSDFKAAKLIDDLKDPNGGNCNSSFVIVKRGADKGINYNLTYKACLKCTSYTNYDPKDTNDECNK